MPRGKNDKINLLTHLNKNTIQMSFASNDTKFQLFEVYGYPNGTRKLIGNGRNALEAELDAREYLTLLGYIININPLTRYFTH